MSSTRSPIIFVCVLGIVITLLSVTGLTIWWKQRGACKFSQALVVVIPGGAATTK
ncbi:MAG TPA: hypothetical protein VL996_01420 [Methylocella sp.]|nr:hypothetical protein [Methylocella sp.]